MEKYNTFFFKRLAIETRVGKEAYACPTVSEWRKEVQGAQWQLRRKSNRGSILRL